jgi:hypothetical protein
MLRFAGDENFNGGIVRGLLRRNPKLDIIRAQDVGLSGPDDPSVLEWVADERRIVITLSNASGKGLSPKTRNIGHRSLNGTRSHPRGPTPNSRTVPRSQADPGGGAPLVPRLSPRVRRPPHIDVCDITTPHEPSVLGEQNIPDWARGGSYRGVTPETIEVSELVTPV